jgi:hypothetical protein
MDFKDVHREEIAFVLVYSSLNTRCHPDTTFQILDLLRLLPKSCTPVQQQCQSEKWIMYSSFVLLPTSDGS